MSFLDRLSTWVVLLVDDEPDNLGVAQQILLHFGADVYTANNGIEALEVLEKVQPTFIIADLSMPKMDGWEVLHTLRRSKTTPVLVLTARDAVSDRVKGLDRGADTR